MDQEKQLEIVMEMIACAGQAKSLAYEGVALAKKGDFAQAKEKLRQAEDCANQAHNRHSDLLIYDANHEDLRLNLLTVHGADHLTGADLATEMARELIEIHQELQELKQMRKKG